MKTRPRVLAALLLAAAPAVNVRAADAGGAPASCPYFYAEMVPGTTNFVRSTPSPRECEFRGSLEEPFAKLAAAAGMTGRAALARWSKVEPVSNAGAYDNGLIAVNDQFIKTLIDKRPAAVVGLAHEIGHAVQERDGAKVKWRAIWSDPSLSEARKLEYSRVYESQADRIGAELLSLAGYRYDFASGILEAFGRDFALRSDHTHPAEGIRWLEALRHQENLNGERYREALAVVRRRTRALMSTPAYDRVPGAQADGDNRTPLEWATSDPAAARYQNRKPYAAPTNLDQYDNQGRLPTTRTWQVTIAEPPLSAAPASLRGDPGVVALPLTDRLALRARASGPQTNYADAVWRGAWVWLRDGGWWGKAEPAAPVKP